MKVKLQWSTPQGDDLVAFMARVSNPENQDNKETAPRLIRYLIAHKHWSPLEMVNACVQIETTRDIAHQIIRHRSFSFQEYSGRYASYGNLLRSIEPRVQDHKNRQSSLACSDDAVNTQFDLSVRGIAEHSLKVYNDLLGANIAREVARRILPEGLVPTTIYMNGTLRSWIHYWDVRCTPETQVEHRAVAEGTRDAILPAFPLIRSVLEEQR